MCYFLPVHHLGMAFLAGSKAKIQQIDRRLYELLLKKIQSELAETATAGKGIEKDCIGNDKENCLNF